MQVVRRDQHNTAMTPIYIPAHRGQRDHRAVHARSDMSKVLRGPVKWSTASLHARRCLARYNVM